MSKSLFLILVLASIVFPAVSCQKAEEPVKETTGSELPECGPGFELHDGDIIFQTSRSSQSRAVQLATHSKYSHMGLVFMEDGRPYVYEAAERVKVTPLRGWISRGEKGKFAIKRLAEYDELPPEALKRMKDAGVRLKGKSYDPYFEWDDEMIYCSELVYKIYKEGGIEIGKLEKFRDFDLSHPEVRKKIQERFGNEIPYDETVISPDSIFNDKKIIGVCTNY